MCTQGQNPDPKQKGKRFVKAILNRKCQHNSAWTQMSGGIALHTQGLNLSLSKQGSTINCRSFHNHIGQQNLSLYMFFIQPDSPGVVQLVVLQHLNS